MRMFVWRLPLISPLLRAATYRVTKADLVERRLREFDWEMLNDVKVTFVIPNNNGLAVGLERLIDSIYAQTHKNIEIVSIDSGSTDDSVAVMKQNGVRVFQIPPSSFTHAYSRNLGASHASGDYLVFTVSDASFEDPDWLRTNLATIRIFGAASLSTPQGFTDDASIYAKLLGMFLAARFPHRGGVLITRPGRIPAKLLSNEIAGRLYGVDDTNHLVRSDVFRQLQFQRSTVEDMDFGKRLYQSGHRLILSGQTAIRHFHDYNDKNKYFCRVFADSKVILELTETNVGLFDYDSVVTLIPLTAILLLENISYYLAESSETKKAAGTRELLTTEEVRLLAHKLVGRDLLHYRLNFSYRKRIAEMTGEVGVLKSGAFRRVGDIEEFFYKRLFSRAVSATFSAADKLGQKLYNLDECTEVINALAINLMAASLAHIPITETSSEPVKNLASIKWK